MRRLLFAPLLLLSVFSALSHASVDQLLQAALDQQLAHHPEWLAMLHYNHDQKNERIFGGEPQSFIDDANFFLSDLGSSSPHDELIATINTFFDGRDSTSRQCRFIARYRWLKSKLNINQSTFDPAKCSEYIEWRQSINANSVTMIFPAAYLNSPSSMFGHTLLRFDPPDEQQDSKWLSWALNFGAEVDADDTSIFYAYKGILGGYPGFFVMMPYFKKIQEYNRLENRDIWEYKLNLTPEEVDRLVDHVWALNEIQFDYFFFDENCSFRLLELLNVARPGTTVTQGFELTAIPVDTIRAVRRSGFLSDVAFRPAHATVLQATAQQLNERQ